MEHEENFTIFFAWGTRNYSKYLKIWGPGIIQNT